MRWVGRSVIEQLVLLILHCISFHSMARANLNKSKKVFTSTTTTQYASPYTRGPESVLIEMAFSQILAIRSE